MGGGAHARSPDSGDAAPELQARPARVRMLRQARWRAFASLVGTAAVGLVVIVGVSLAWGLAWGAPLALVAVAGSAWACSHLTTRMATRLFSQQDRVVLSAVHEVRRPISVLVAAVGEGTAGLVQADEALGQTAERLDALVMVIDDLVELAELMTGAVALSDEPVRLDLLVASMSADAVPGRAELVTDVSPVWLPGSERVLRVAIGNLVRNAAQHGYQLGEGEVEVAVDSEGVVVRDRGPGLSEVALADLARDPWESDREGPARFGLNLVTWVAEAHGGRLEVSNRPGGGLEARMCLPVREGVPG